MRAALALLTVAVGAVAGAAPAVVAGGSVDAFLVGLAIWAFIPLALLAAPSRLISVPGLLLTLFGLAAVQ